MNSFFNSMYFYWEFNLFTFNIIAAGLCIAILSVFFLMPYIIFTSPFIAFISFFVCLFVCLSVKLFISPSNMNDSLVAQSILGCRFSPIITLNISCPSILPCRVSAELSVHSLVGLTFT